MKLSVPKESVAGETRVAIVPEVVKKLTAGGIEVVVEDVRAGAGAKLEPGAGFSGDVVAKVQPPTADEIGRLQRGSALIAFLQPLTNGEVAKGLADAGVTAFAMEAVPRITRAQSMDALSSQATVAGYRAALIGAQELGRFLPMLTTAAGTIRPAKVLVLGAGVAGLQAIATARRLGAVVSAFDVRSAVKEQIESLGARFVALAIGLEDAEDAGGYARALTDEEQQRQREALADVIAQMDIVISTAAVPGRKAPLLVIEDAVKRMPAGAVIVDLAAETGGNCELDRARPDRDPPRREDRRRREPARDDARPRVSALRQEHPGAARPDGRRGGRVQARLRRRGDRRRLHHARRRDRARGRQGSRRRSSRLRRPDGFDH